MANKGGQTAVKPCRVGAHCLTRKEATQRPTGANGGGIVGAAFFFV